MSSEGQALDWVRDARREEAGLPGGWESNKAACEVKRPRRARVVPTLPLVLALVLGACGSSSSSSSGQSGGSSSGSSAGGGGSGATKTLGQIDSCMSGAGLKTEPDSSGRLDLGGNPRPGYEGGLKVRIQGHQYPVVVSVYDSATNATKAASDTSSIVLPEGIVKTSGNVLEWSAQKLPKSALAPIDKCV